MNDLLNQTLLNRYRVDSFLGRGGMADVYRVWDSERAVTLAMKVLREDLSQDFTFLRRFQREARVLESLRHPHIVRYYGLEQEDLLAFMLMDYVDGTTLRAEIFKRRREPFRAEEILHYLQPVCSALHYAHRQGVVHCDVKPANVLIEKTGRILVSDFGIARLAESATVTFSTPGTPAYMSPEQCKGSEDLDARTDVYSLGILLYEMVTGGERPFSGDTRLTTGSAGERIRWQHLNEPPPSSKRFNPELPAGLEAVIVRCLAKTPADRFQSAMELWDALQSAAGQAAPAMTPGAAQGKLTAKPEASVTAQPPIVPPVDAPRAPIAPPAQADAAPQPSRLGLWIALGGIAVVLLLVIGGAFGRPTPATLVAPAGTPVPTPTLGIGSTMVSDKDGMLLLYVPAGNFLMGSSDSDSQASSDEKPQHTVYLDAFWIDKTEVTNVQFQKFEDATSYQTDAEKRGWSYLFNPSSGNWEQTNGADWRHPQGPTSSVSGLETHPVVNVSWDDAEAYCQWAGRRLPTEAEWEKTARGPSTGSGDGRIYPWGNASPDSPLLNFGGNVGGTTEVGSHLSGASPYGALDMAGNVWEWVNDWYDSSYYSSSPSANPHGPTSGDSRVLRGGSWGSGAQYVRVAYRIWYVPDVQNGNFGFRCSR